MLPQDEGCGDLKNVKELVDAKVDREPIGLEVVYNRVEERVGDEDKPDGKLRLREQDERQEGDCGPYAGVDEKPREVVAAVLAAELVIWIGWNITGVQNVLPPLLLLELVELCADLQIEVCKHMEREDYDGEFGNVEFC